MIKPTKEIQIGAARHEIGIIPGIAALMIVAALCYLCITMQKLELLSALAGIPIGYWFRGTAKK